MSNNTTLNTGTGGDILRTIDKTTYKVASSVIDVGGSSTESLVGDSGVTLPVGGLVAHDGVASGKPLIIGAFAKATAPTAVSADGDVAYLWTDLSGRLQVGDGGSTLSIDDGAGSITVDGTVAATQSGTWNVVCTNAGTFATQAAQSGTWNITNISGTISLPTGAATAAKQPALGTAGTASADVITIQGVSSMTPVQIGDNNSTISIDDGAGSITVDGTVGISGTVTISGAVTNAGTFAVQESGAALTSLQLIDDAVYTDGSGTPSKGLAVMGTDGTNPQIISTQTSGAINIHDGGNVISVDDGAGTLSIDDGAGSITVDGTVAVSTVTTVTTVSTVTTVGTVTAVSDAQVQGKAAHDAASSGNPVLIGAYAKSTAPTNVSTDGDAVNLWADLAGRLQIGDGAGSITVDNAGTFAVQAVCTNAGTFAVQATCTNAGTFAVQAASAGDVAHDGADSGNPVKQGAKATTSLSGLTMVADADRTNLFAGVDGVQIIRPNSNLEDLVSGVAAITDGSSTSVISAGGANVKIYITGIVIANSSSTNVTVDIRDGTAGSVKMTLPVPANGGVVLNLTTPLGGFTTNTAVAADPSASASTITVTLTGFKSKI